MTTSALVLTALLMGLAGGPHCLAMCGLACAGLGRAAGLTSPKAMGVFHAGRVSGYALLGAVAGASAQSVGWLAERTSVLRPVWTVLLLGTFAFGFWMLAAARQPAWVEAAGRRVWSRVKPVASRWGQGTPFVLGCLWALMPCSLLYSALLVALLSGSAFNGGMTMMLFGLGSTVVMMGGTAVIQKLMHRRPTANLHIWGVRLAGLVLALGSVWALWMGASSASGFWCFAS